MSEVLLIWLWLSIAKVAGVGVFIAVVYFLAVSIFSFGCMDDVEVDWYKEKVVPHFKRAIVLFFVFAPLKCFIPSEKEMYTIIGGAVAWNTSKSVLSSEEAKKLPNNVLEAMNRVLENIETKETQ